MVTIHLRFQPASLIHHIKFSFTCASMLGCFACGWVASTTHGYQHKCSKSPSIDDISFWTQCANSFSLARFQIRFWQNYVPTKLWRIWPFVPTSTQPELGTRKGCGKWMRSVWYDNITNRAPVSIYIMGACNFYTICGTQSIVTYSVYLLLGMFSMLTVPPFFTPFGED